MGMKRIDKMVKKNGLLCIGVRKLLHLYYARMFGVSADEFNQLETTTAYNRYPELFSSVCNLMPPRDAEQIRILSYGCSTGQECWTLRNYFPNAHVVGLDINERSLCAGRAKNTDPKIEFLPSTSENLMSHGPYDVIFALSVLCRWPETQFVADTSRLYPFQKFDHAITRLDSALSVGGLMVILNANYHFSDASVSGRYQGVTGLRLSQYECVHRFSKDNKKIGEDGMGEWIFKKTAMGCSI
jgi:Methyltransferase domain